MKIIITGAGGFLGSNLSKELNGLKHEVVSLNRKDLSLSVEDLIIKIRGADVIINLAGATILRRWTVKNKKLIYNSRMETTRKLCLAVSLMHVKPKMFISASAVGIYKNSGIQTEMSDDLADDFLGDVCKNWEKEAMAVQYYANLTLFRFGIILGRKGGSLPKMIRPFKLFLGGKIASGKQGFSWVHIDDVVEAFLFVINTQGNYGILNLCAPQPITNSEFTKAVSEVLSRPAFFRIPSFLLRLLYGEASVLLTEGQFVVPEKLVSLGFKFKYPDIKSALENLLR